MRTEELIKQAALMSEVRIDTLRGMYCTSVGITTLNVQEDRQHTLGMTRGQMIEIILRNDFTGDSE